MLLSQRSDKSVNQGLTSQSSRLKPIVMAIAIVRLT